MIRYNWHLGNQQKGDSKKVKTAIFSFKRAPALKVGGDFSVEQMAVGDLIPRDFQ